MSHDTFPYAALDAYLTTEPEPDCAPPSWWAPIVPAPPRWVLFRGVALRCGFRAVPKATHKVTPIPSPAPFTDADIPF